MTDRPDFEDTLILALLDDGAAPVRAIESRGPDPGEDDRAQTLRRLYVELLGLLPWATEPREPLVELKTRMFAALESRERARRPVAPSPTAAVEEAEVFPVRSAAVTEGGSAAPPRPSPWIVWAAAAAIALAAIGLGAAAWLFLELQDTEERLARLEGERRELVEVVDQRGRQVDLMAGELGRITEAVGLMTTRGVEVCPLRPMGEEPMQPGAFAVLFMAPEQDRWYLRTSNLDPAPSGRSYQVWFYTSDGVVPGGVLQGDEGDLYFSARRLGDAMMQGVAVTLEPEDRSVPAPSGPMVLFGDEKMQVL